MSKIADDREWLDARLELLAAEKSLQKARDRVREQRRALPWRPVSEEYRFEGEDGPATLAELFDGLSQLVVYHFMFHPDWDEGCKSCSFWADSFDGAHVHLRARDVNLVAISRAPLAKLLAYRDRLGWRFPWVSSAGNRFNYDFNVSFEPDRIESGETVYNYEAGGGTIEELPGISVFARKGGRVFHTYSTYSRGLDPFNVTYQFLDIVPAGRNEDGLSYTMEWLRRRDEYQ